MEGGADAALQESLGRSAGDMVKVWLMAWVSLAAGGGE